MSITKLLHPLVIKGKKTYPLTSADQVIKADGNRLEENNKINADLLCGFEPNYFLENAKGSVSIDLNNSESSEQGALIDADSLGGILAKDYVTKDNSPFKFGIDSNGNYGYIKDGADTVTPFNLLLNAEVVYTNSKTVTVPEGVRAAILSQVACYTGRVAPEFYHNGVSIDYIAWKQLEHNLDMLTGMAILPSVKSGDTVGFMSDGQTWENHVIVWLK